MADILVVDDDQAVATAFERFLEFEGHTCRLANSAATAQRLIEARRPDVVMMDIQMPGQDGLSALVQFREQFPGLCIVMMTAYGSSQTSIDAIRTGAFDYLNKPLSLDELRIVLNKALAAQRLADTGEPATAPFGPRVALVGEAPAMLDIYKMIGRLATNSVPALAVGERGTGRRLVIAAIHDNSQRRGPLVGLESATVSESQLAAALFEHPDGTVVLTEIDSLSLPLQAVLAHALSGTQTTGGAGRAMARVFATTEKDLGQQVRNGSFNPQLYGDLSVITLRLPPLRDRRDDIPLLVRHMIQRFNNELSLSITKVADDVMAMLQRHGWPGNVAELERVIKRACIIARSDVITADDIGDSLSHGRYPVRADIESVVGSVVRAALHERLVQATSPSASPYHEIVDSVETVLVREALAITSGNQVKAAEILGVNRATLRKKMVPGA